MKEHLASNRILRLLFWESTIKCNLSCAHCRRIESDEMAFSDLSTDEARNLIKQLAEFGMTQPTMPILVFSGGEPLCRKDIFELAGYARDKGIVTALATNGTLIDKAAARQIADAGIARVAVSLDGATAEVHNKLRQGEDSFERASKGIGHLREANVAFQINTALGKHNAEQINAIYELANSLGAAALHIFMLVPVGCGQILAETDMLSRQEYEQKMVEICELEVKGRLQVKVTCGPHYERIIRQQGLLEARKEKADSGSVPGRSRDGSVSRGCLAGLGVLFVGHQGDVFPCGYLPVKCGNILDSTITEIWDGSKVLAEICDSNKLEGKCGVCGYRHVCGGCRARAYAATGNYMAEEPFCAHIPPEATSQGPAV